MTGRWQINACIIKAYTVQTLAKFTLCVSKLSVSRTDMGEWQGRLQTDTEDSTQHCKLQKLLPRNNNNRNRNNRNTLIESKQQTTRPFCTSTCRGGWAKRHSSSGRIHRPRTCSRHTSSVSHRESFPPPPLPVVTRVVRGAEGVTVDVVDGATTAALQDDDEGPVTAATGTLVTATVRGRDRATYALTLAITVLCQRMCFDRATGLNSERVRCHVHCYLSRPL